MTERVVVEFAMFRAVTRKPSIEYGDTVFVQRKVDGEWQDVARYNSMSNDDAYIEAREHAERLQKQFDKPGN
jgi:hypothetical protein